MSCSGDPTCCLWRGVLQLTAPPCLSPSAAERWEGALGAGRSLPLPGDTSCSLGFGKGLGQWPFSSGSCANKLMAQQLQWEKGVVIVPGSTECQVGTRSLASGQGQAMHHPALKHFLAFLIQTGVGPGAYQKASPVWHCLQLIPAISRGLNVVTRTGWFLSVAFSMQLCLPWDRCTVSGWVVAIRKQSWCYFLLFLCCCYPFLRICIACSLGWHFNNH